jgi:hypothetical protein
MQFDLIVAKLGCPRCGAVPEGEGDAGLISIQAYVREEPSWANLGVGDSVSVKAIEASGCYLTIRPALPEEVVRLLCEWHCPRMCSPEYVWAQISIQNDVISSIDPTILTQGVLRGAHFVSDEAMSLAVEPTERCWTELRSLSDAEAIEILLSVLPP